MERKKIIALMDYLIRSTEIYNKCSEKLAELSDWKMQVCIPSYPAKSVHVYAGIEDMAKAVNREIVVRHRDDIDYPVQKSFTYKGYLIYEIQNIEEFLKDKE